MSRLVIERQAHVNALATSLTIVVFYSGFAGGIILLVTVKRKLIYTLIGTPLIFAGLPPVVVLMAQDRSPFGLLAGYFAPSFWITYVATEAVLAAVLLLWAWRAWPKTELG